MMENKRRELTEALQAIGWDLLDAGCDHWRLVNHLKEDTGFIYYHGQLRTEGPGAKELYGRKASENGSSGLVYFDLRESEIKVSKDKNAVSVRASGANSCFLSFYNFTKKGGC